MSSQFLADPKFNQLFTFNFTLQTSPLNPDGFNSNEALHELFPLSPFYLTALSSHVGGQRDGKHTRLRGRM